MPEVDQRPRLADLCCDVFAYTFQLRAGKDPGPCNPVKQRFGALFIDFEQRARTAGYKPESIQAGKYAMTAFIDEVVTSSKFPMKDEWAGSPLQLEYFNEFAAGEEFYAKMKAIRAGGDSEKRPVIEIYFLCLTHGFKGMYIDLKGMEERKGLMDQLAAELKQGKTGDAFQLSPSWKPSDELPRLVRSTPTWLIPAICVVLLILLLVILGATAGAMADGAVETLNGVES
jgi:type VI secretion system protein ImpK